MRQPFRSQSVSQLGALASFLALLTALSGLPRPWPVTRRAVCGRVSHAGLPVSGATVRWQTAGRSTVTDAGGRFVLPGPAQGRRVTASKEGFVIAGAQGGCAPLDLHLVALPAEDNESYAWIDPTPSRTDGKRCGNCHGEIHREWAASGHARSATGRHFRNLYEGTGWDGRRAGWSLLADHPDGAGVCAACHAPTLSLGDPARFDLRALAGVAARGVHCDFCHKIRDVGTGAIGLGHGVFNYQLLRPARGQLFFGPLDDVDRGEDACSPLYRKSEYCAACHEGVVFGVPVYTTWSEYLASPARREGKQCQDCHMRPTGRMTNVAPGRGGLERDPRTLGNHRFFDGSRDEMLRRCLSMTATVQRRPGETKLAVTVVAQDVGHRVPTGFIDRHVLLHVEASDAHGGRVEMRKGPVLPAACGAELAGRPGRLFARLPRDGGGTPLPFWRLAGDLEDSRLLPGRPETTVLLFPPAISRLRVRLIYRRFWQEVARSKHWPCDDVLVAERVIAGSPVPLAQAEQAVSE